MTSRKPTLLSVASALALSSFLFADLVTGSAPKGAWDEFNYAPNSRVVRPTSIFKSSGSIQNLDSLFSDEGHTTISGSGSYVSLDFGKEVGGLITMSLSPSTSNSSFSLSFSESPMFVSPSTSDDSTYPAPNASYDGVEPVLAPLPSGLWTQPAYRLRGGFRYLTIRVDGDGDGVGIGNVTCEISFMPHVEDMRDYAGYFWTKNKTSKKAENGEDLNQDIDPDFWTKLWYAGAYTVQTNIVPLDTGRQIPPLASPNWANNATLGVAGPIIVDGAKRDRAVWPGDMGIAVPTAFVSTNDLIPVKNALSTMFAAINPSTGALPESGPPLSQLDSDTYHGWTLIGTYNYYLYSGDDDWLKEVWANYTKAVQFLENKSTSNGLINITGLRDWARLGGGGINAEGNAIYYKVLTTGAELATYINETSQASEWSEKADIVKSSFNDVFWVEELGMYRDNSTTTLCPQDANSFAVLFNLTQNVPSVEGGQGQAGLVSKGLEKNWNELGAVAPELPDTISPFIGGFEIQAHFESGNAGRAVELMRREWGYMLYTNLSVQSTLLEGYTANGSLGYRSYRGYNYDPAYTSHAHGWSSGPTSTLTNYILGLQVRSPKGREWTLKPSVFVSDESDEVLGFDDVQGGFETGLGWFGARWVLSDGKSEEDGKKNSRVLTITVNTPSGTSGLVTVPPGIGTTHGTTILLDGREVSAKGSKTISVEGGNHTIVAY